MRSWVVWIPALMVGGLVYWTVALGLGGLSLMTVSSLSGGEGGTGMIDVMPGVMPSAAATAIDTGGVGAPRDGYEPILVHIEESAEPEDVNDNVGCGLTDEVAARADSGGASRAGNTDGEY
jgi:hypothetical protein